MTITIRHLLPTTMKRFTLVLLLSLVGATAACSKSSTGDGTALDQEPATAQAELHVEGMHCATCPVTVKAAAEGIGGVSSVRVSMDEAKAWVTFDPTRTNPAETTPPTGRTGFTQLPHPRTDLRPP